jgi:polyisoprenoid-binding protein YceI
MSERAAASPAVREVNGRQVPVPGTWVIDPAHSSFEFVALHLMTRVRGRFSGVNGEAVIAEIPEESWVQIEIDASTVDTREPNRDAHLRSSDFFGVEDHRTLTFCSTAVRSGAGEIWKVDGDLTVRGVTRPIAVDLKFLGAAVDSQGNQRIGFSGVVPEVNREEWGLTWNEVLETGGFLLSKNIRLEIEAELLQKA